MYFPTASPKLLTTSPALPNIPAEPVIGLTASPTRKTLFCTLSRNGLTVWNVRPFAILAYLSRTPTSILDHGENINAWWSPDSARIIIQTSESYLVLVTVTYLTDQSVYKSPLLPINTQRSFLPGPGEGLPVQGMSLHFEGVIRVEGTILSVSPRQSHLLFSTQDPPTVQRMPWPNKENDPVEQLPVKYDTWLLNDEDFSWFVESDVAVKNILYSKAIGAETWITSDGRVYFVQLHDGIDDGSNGELYNVEFNANDAQVPAPFESTEHSLSWQGTCVHDFKTPRWVQKQRHVEEVLSEHQHKYNEPRRAEVIAINSKFSLLGIGTVSGALEFTNFPSQAGVPPKSQSIQIPNPYNQQTGSVCALEWSSDGYVLAVGWDHGWGIFSVGGKCLASKVGVNDNVNRERFQDSFHNGIRQLFWAPGNFELVVLSSLSSKSGAQLFAIPFAKSATTGQHSPDNTRYAFLQMDDRALVYRGADQPDMSVINPESDVWQHIKIPQRYLATNWPVRYSSLSNDGRLVAIAGRRGLIHYSSSSGRWKIFADEVQEQAFIVKGGLLWFHHVLIAAVDVNKSYQIHLYSRDMELTAQNILHLEVLSSPVIILSLVDNSLLVYTADNALHHYLIIPTSQSIKLHFCGSIGFTGIIAAPSAVRVLSWMIPSSQKQFGDPVDDLSVATVLMVVGGQLILLRPRKTANQEVNYDMQVFADRIEFCWIHLRGIGALENSLWAYDAQGIRVWLNALSIEAPQRLGDSSENVKESVNIPLDFYPLSVLMDKGIIIGAEHEAATKSNLPFVLFRHATSSYLFLQYILLYHLGTRQLQDAIAFASHYKNLVFFAHALEILLHTVVESDSSLSNGSVDEGNSPDSILHTVVEFLDHFDVALDVVVGCARKTEMTRWRRLFDIVGNPKSLFETCLASKRLKTAGSYLLVLHNLEQLDEENDDVIRLLKSAAEGKDWHLCRELLRFLHSIDDTGDALRKALSRTDFLNIERYADGIR